MIESSTNTVVQENPFSTIANDYDSDYFSNEVFQWMRRRVWRVADCYLGHENNVLELGCGTGIDAIHFVSKGLNWWATDSSSKMLEFTDRKRKAITNKDKIHIDFLDINDPFKSEVINQNNSFHGIFANFGVLNCVHDMSKFCEFSSRLLLKDGILFATIMSKICLWEILYYLLQGSPQKAFRRLKSNKQVPIGDQYIKTYYFSPRKFISSFKNQFKMEAIYGLGVVVPPPYLYKGMESHQNILAVLKWFEEKISSPPILRGWGDHFIVVLRKVSE